MKKKKINIIGAGPAGLACGIQLVKEQHICCIYEKEKNFGEKVCGEGISEAATNMLAELDITPDILKEAGAHPILKSLHDMDGRMDILAHKKDTCYTLERVKLIELMLAVFIENGGKLQTSTKIGSHDYRNFLKDDIWVNASGCTISKNSTLLLTQGLPVGLSMTLEGKSILEQTTMYFVHRKRIGDGYAWAFPLGKDRWNIGIWQTKQINSINNNLNIFLTNWIAPQFSMCNIVKKAKGTMLGTHPTAYEDPDHNYYICGDIAGTCNKKSGEGISSAIKSGLDTADKIIRRG